MCKEYIIVNKKPITLKYLIVDKSIWTCFLVNQARADYSVHESTSKVGVFLNIAFME